MRLWIIACLPLAVWLASGQAFGGEPAPVVKCDVAAYMDGYGPKVLNVRAGPSPTAAIVGRIREPAEPGGDAVGLHITASSGEWLQIGRTETMDGTVVFKGTGWVYGPLMGVSANSPSARLRERPQTGGRVVAVVPSQDGGQVLGCKGEWVKIRYKGKEGWAAPGSYCGNPVTTCP
jgi:SH3-like domain-containing protein